MSRLRSNCSEMRVKPRKLVEAIISELAPGKAACTSKVGNSTSGSGETGKNWYARAPARASARVSSVVPMGRWMNRAEKGMRPPHACKSPWWDAGPGVDVDDHRTRLRRPPAASYALAPGTPPRGDTRGQAYVWSPPGTPCVCPATALLSDPWQRWQRAARRAGRRHQTPARSGGPYRLQARHPCDARRATTAPRLQRYAIARTDSIIQ